MKIFKLIPEWVWFVLIGVIAIGLFMLTVEFLETLASKL